MKKQIRVSITGDSGSGKTTILYAIKKALEDAGIDVDIDMNSQTMRDSGGRGFSREQIDRAIEQIGTSNYRPLVILDDQPIPTPKGTWFS